MKKCYFEIAEAVCNKNAQSAVGLAYNKNPIMIVIVIGLLHKMEIWVVLRMAIQLSKNYLK